MADGAAAAVENSEQSNGASGVALAAADFDSDGVADLVTADQNGNLKFYRGNIDSIYENAPEAKQRQANNTFTAAPFYAPARNFSLNFAPDFLFSGDFNADGKADLLAAALNSDSLFLLTGDGQGNFNAPQAIGLGGKLTAVAVGEIGRADGQADVAAAIVNEKGAELLVFENPESAFKQKPEMIKLSAAADDIAIGDLDGDSYGDTALAGGTNLTIVHGRGQAYPFDRVADDNLKRPSAIVENRLMPSQIAALAIGQFTGTREKSLAILSANGSLQTLETVKTAKSNLSLSKRAKLQKQSENVSFAPSETDFNEFALLAQKLPENAETAEKQGLLMADSTLSRSDLLKNLLEKNKNSTDFAALSEAEKSTYEWKPRKNRSKNGKRRKNLLKDQFPPN